MKPNGEEASSRGRESANLKYNEFMGTRNGKENGGRAWVGEVGVDSLCLAGGGALFVRQRFALPFSSKPSRQ